MRYKGTYDPTATYEVGDVVIFENGVVYHLQKAAEAGTAPTDTRYWGQLEQNLSDAVKIVGNAGGGGGGSGGGMVVEINAVDGNMVMNHTWKEIHDAIPVMPVAVYANSPIGYAMGIIESVSPPSEPEENYEVLVRLYVMDSEIPFSTQSEDGYPSAPMG